MVAFEATGFFLFSIKKKKNEEEEIEKGKK
jgi:hypothetical protein